MVLACGPGGEAQSLEKGKTLSLPPPICIHTGSLLRLAAGSGPKVLMGPSCPSPAGRMLGSLVRKPTPHRSISTKVLLTEGEDTPFSEHCRHYEDSYRVSGGQGSAGWERPHRSLSPKCSGQIWSWPRGPPRGAQPGRCSLGLPAQRLQAEIQNLKDQVQELHRDLTKHHSLIEAEIMGDLLHKSLQVDAQIASEYASLQGMRAVFQEVADRARPRPPSSPAPDFPAAPPVSLNTGYPKLEHRLPQDRKGRKGGP